MAINVSARVFGQELQQRLLLSGPERRHHRKRVHKRQVTGTLDAVPIRF